jgi:hypothetical protein
VDIRVIRMTEICEWRKQEQGSVRSMVIKLDRLKEKVKNMIIERDWLNVLVDRGGNSYVIQADQV